MLYACDSCYDGVPPVTKVMLWPLQEGLGAKAPKRQLFPTPAGVSVWAERTQNKHLFWV